MACACFHVQKATKLAGYHFPTSRDSQEKFYASRYSESSQRKSRSPSTKKQLEAAIDALSSYSSDPDIWDPIEKTPEELAAWFAELER